MALTGEDIKDWTPEMLNDKISELDKAYEELQLEYHKKRKQLVDDLTVLRIKACNVSIMQALGFRHGEIK